MSINREHFLSLLEQVTPGLSTREIVDQSSCFVFTGKTLATFNDDVACRVPVKTDFVGAIQAEPLLNILRKLTEDTLETEVNQLESGTQLILRGKRKKMGIAMEATIQLPIKSIEKPTEWVKLHPEFADGVSMVKECAGKDESYFQLTCVHVHPQWVEATDGRQVARYKVTNEIESPFLIRKASLKNIISLNMLELSETPAWVHFRNDSGLILSCRRYLETFMDMGEFLKVKGHPIKLPKGLVDAAQKASIFSSQSADDNIVIIELQAGKMKLTGKGVTGWYTEIKNVDYAGEPLKFSIAPALLCQLVQKYNECQLAPGRLRVSGKNFRYITCLGEVAK